LSSDPNKGEETTGTLGEGTGVRETTNLDEINHEFKKSDEELENAVKPKSKIRCHRCSTAKNEEDVGVFIQINNFIAWFHNKECRDLWHESSSKNYRTGADIDQSTGHEVIEVQETKLQP
jgi:hypothetical protein